jgi:hypothetical protein
MTPEKPQAQPSSSGTTPISTLRCLKMRLSVSSSSMSSTCLQEWVAELAAMSSTSCVRQVLVHAAGPEIGRVHARTRGPLVEHHQLLALFEAPERRGERADVHGLRGHVQEMREERPISE